MIMFYVVWPAGVRCLAIFPACLCGLGHGAVVSSEGSSPWCPADIWIPEIRSWFPKGVSPRSASSQLFFTIPFLEAAAHSSSLLSRQRSHHRSILLLGRTTRYGVAPRMHHGWREVVYVPTRARLWP